MESQRDKDILEFEEAKRKLLHEIANAFGFYKILDWLAPKADKIVKRIDKITGR